MKKFLLILFLGVSFFPRIAYTALFEEKMMRIDATYPHSSVQFLTTVFKGQRYLLWLDVSEIAWLESSFLNKFTHSQKKLIGLENKALPANNASSDPQEIPFLIKDSFDIGLALRYQWNPGLMIGGYCFINTPKFVYGSKRQDILPYTLREIKSSLKKPREVNPGIEFFLPTYRMMMSANAHILIQAEDLVPYHTGEFKFASYFTQNSTLFCGLYYLKYQGEPWHGGIAIGAHYINYWPNFHGIVKMTYDSFNKRIFLFGVQYTWGQAQHPYHSMPSYLRSPIDRYLAPMTHLRVPTGSHCRDTPANKELRKSLTDVQFNYSSEESEYSPIEMVDLELRSVSPTPTDGE